MTFRPSRRLFLGGSAFATLRFAVTPAFAKSEKGELLLLVHDSARQWTDVASTLALASEGRPALVVAERPLPGTGTLIPACTISWGALDLLTPERLLDLARTGAPLRVASSAGRLPVPSSGGFAKLGRLMALGPPFRLVMVDLAGGGRIPSPNSVAEGIAAFRAGLGTQVATRLVVRSTADPGRTG